MTETIEFVGRELFVPVKRTESDDLPHLRTQADRDDFSKSVTVTLANGDRHVYGDWSGERHGGVGGSRTTYFVDPSGALHIAYSYSVIDRSNPRDHAERGDGYTVRTYGIGWVHVDGARHDDPHNQRPRV